MIVDLNNLSEVENALNSMKTSDISYLSEKLLVTLHNKLREEQGFACNVQITGSIEGDFTYLYMINADNMGNGVEYREVIRIGGCIYD